MRKKEIPNSTHEDDWRFPSRQQWGNLVMRERMQIQMQMQIYAAFEGIYIPRPCPSPSSCELQMSSVLVNLRSQSSSMKRGSWYVC